MAAESAATKSERKETRVAAVPTDPKVDKKALEKEKEMDKVLENIKNIFRA